MRPVHSRYHAQDATEPAAALQDAIRARRPDPGRTGESGADVGTGRGQLAAAGDLAGHRAVHLFWLQPEPQPADQRGASELAQVRHGLPDFSDD